MIRVLSISMLVVAALAGRGVAQPAPPTAEPAAPVDAAAARKACTAAMNADPTFAADVINVARQKATDKSSNAFFEELCRDSDTVKSHQDAVYHVEKNEKHVIYAYAAMWIVAAGFVLFLWRRQQVLKLEIAHLRRDLEAAAGDTGSKEPKT